MREGRVDLAICGGDASPADFRSEVLADLEGVAVSAPARTGGTPPPGDIAELLRCDLLWTRSSPGLWPRWLSRIRPGATGRPSGPGFPTLNAMYEAAASGLGVTIAVPLVADRYLAEGRLEPRLGLRAAVGDQYRLVYAGGRSGDRPPVAAFVRWLRAEVQASCSRFAETGALAR